MKRVPLIRVIVSSYWRAGHKPTRLDWQSTAPQHDEAADVAAKRHAAIGTQLGFSAQQIFRQRNQAAAQVYFRRGDAHSSRQAKRRGRVDRAARFKKVIGQDVDIATVAEAGFR